MCWHPGSPMWEGSWPGTRPPPQPPRTPTTRVWSRRAEDGRHRLPRCLKSRACSREEVVEEPAWSAALEEPQKMKRPRPDPPAVTTDLITPRLSAPNLTWPGSITHEPSSKKWAKGRPPLQASLGWLLPKPASPPEGNRSLLTVKRRRKSRNSKPKLIRRRQRPRRSPVLRRERP